MDAGISMKDLMVSCNAAKIGNYHITGIL